MDRVTNDIVDVRDIYTIDDIKNINVIIESINKKLKESKTNKITVVKDTNEKYNKYVMKLLINRGYSVIETHVYKYYLNYNEPDHLEIPVFIIEY